jgi:methionyl-tRNA formyltransferase
MLRLVFMGSPAFAVPTLAEIIAAGHDVAAVYTQPPKPANRGMAETKSAVHTFAEASGLNVITPKTLKSSEAQAQLASLKPDVAVVVAYGMLLPQAILDIPRFGCLNLHPSLLPRWRGAAPIHRPIMAGDKETAAIVMKMEAGLDTGPMCLAERLPIPPDATTGDLHDILKVQGAGLMVRALAALERGSLKETPQAADGVTYATKITNAECRIDFAKDASTVWNQIRGLSPAPGAFFELEIDGKRERFKVLRGKPNPTHTHNASPGAILDDRMTIACSQGTFSPTEVQRAGKKAMPIADVLNGLKLKPGSTVLT